MFFKKLFFYFKFFDFKSSLHNGYLYENNILKTNKYPSYELFKQ